ncbi:MAG: hypothetical protein GXO48_09555 [Chlorobi bacterium]|nr:hypothetical protein [Chlorobiota bacterium]
MDNMISKIRSFLILLAIIISAIILITFSVSIISRHYSYSSIIFISLAYLFFAWLIYSLSKRFSIFQTLVIPFLLGLALRIIWLYTVNPLPIFDYFRYYSFMLEVKNHEPLTFFPAQTFFWVIMSLVLKLFPFIEPGTATQFLLAFLQALTGVIIGKALMPFNRQIAITTAYLWALYPADVFFSGVLSTDLPQAFLTALLLLTISRWHLTQSNKYLLLTGIVMMFVLLTRKAGLFMIVPVALIPLIVATNYKNFSEIVKKYLSLLQGSLIAFIISILIASLASKTFPPPKDYWWGNTTMLPLLAGTNFQHKGLWNKEDYNLYNSLPLDTRNKIVIDTAFQRLINIYTNPVKAFRFSSDKLKGLFNYYALYWSIDAPLTLIESNKVPENIKEDFGFKYNQNHISKLKRLQNLLIPVELAGLLTILVLALLGTIWIAHAKYVNNLIFAYLYSLIISTYIIAHMAFEVQGRYHHMLLPFIFAVAGWALCWMDKCRNGN